MSNSFVRSHFQSNINPLDDNDHNFGRKMGARVMAKRLGVKINRKGCIRLEEDPAMLYFRSHWPA